MSINQSAPSLEIFTHEMLDGHGIEVSHSNFSGRVQAMIIHKDSKQGNYGFSLDLLFAGDLTDTATGDDNIVFQELMVNKAHTWYDRKSGGDAIEYQLGSDDRKILIPALKKKILDKIIRAEITTILPQSLFNPEAVQENFVIEQAEVAHIAINFDSECHSVDLHSDNTASGELSMLIDGEIEFAVEFTAEYKEVFERPVFSNGKLIKAKVDTLAEIKITDLTYGCFTHLETEEYDYHYDVTKADVDCIQALITKQIEDAHDELAYPLGKQHPLVA